ncbi:MAG TPA: maltose acetyltransferase [Clostridiales bacterium]|nr:maltose acetyltransferase [Clostridiales bacterium]
MNEEDKMLAGELYNSRDKQLLNKLIRAKKLCNKYNKLDVEDIEKCNEIIRELFSKTGKEFMIIPNFYCDYGFNIEIGENFYSNHNLVILDANKVTFGDNVQIGPNCGFYTSGHPLDYETRKKLEFAKPIKIGNNVWIGGNVCVMPGVTIGDNTVIGAGSVVTKEIPSNVVAVGNPCRVIKKIIIN